MVAAVHEMTTEELIEEFDFLGTWEEQCRYLIELGEELPDLTPAEKTDENRVQGCQANVWFIPRAPEQRPAPHLHPCQE